MAPEETKVNASPAAAELASEKGVDLANVKGTGADGIVTKGDVEKALGADGGNGGGSSASSSKSKSEGIGNVGTRPVVNDDDEVVDEPGTYYCPGCGLRYQDPGTCSGTAEGPHDPIDLVSVKELSGDESKHTPAPATEG